MTRLPDPFATDPFSQRRRGGAKKPQQFAQPIAGRPEEPEVFELAFGFIPTINVGTALGVENDVGRIALDILLDPIALAGAFFTGGLTVAGKATVASSKLANAGGKLAKLSKLDSAGKLKGLSSVLELSAKGISNPALLRTLKGAAEAGDFKKLNKTLGQIRKSGISDDIAKKLPGSDELGFFKTAFEAEEKLRKANLVLAAKGKDALRMLPKQASRPAEVVAKQRDFLRFKVPFTQIESTLIEGKKIWSRFDEIFPYTKTLADGKTSLKGLAKTVVSQRSIDMGEHLATSIIKKAKRNKGFATLLARAGLEAGQAAPLKKLAFFYREGKATGKGLPSDPDLLKNIGLEEFIGADLETFSKLKAFTDEKGMTTAMEYSDNILTAHYDSFLGLLNQSRKAGGQGEISRIEGYLQHIYDLDDIPPAVTEVASRFARKAGFFKQRTISDMFTAMTERGFTPKNLDVFDLAEKYHTATANIITANTAVNTFKNSKVLRVLDEGQKGPKMMNLFATADKARKLKLADEGWVPLKDLDLTRKLGIGTKSFKNKKGETIIKAEEMWVPRDIERALKVMADKPSNNIGLRAMEQFNAITKTLGLSASLFHSAALLESLVAVSGFKGLAFGLKQGAGVPILSQMLHKGGIAKQVADFDARQIIEAAKYMNIEMSSDVRIGQLNQFIDNFGKVARKVPGGDLLTKPLGKFVEFQNEALWETLHVPSKIFGFNHKVNQLLKQFPDVPVEDLKKMAGQFMDDAFGGQNWERLMVTPKMKQLAHASVFAPDWTMSNLRIFGQLAKSTATKVKSIKSGVPLTDIEKAQSKLSQGYWMRAGMGLFATTNLLNQAFTGKWMWENETGHTADISLGFNEDTGKNEYVKLGKQLREPIRWMTNPIGIGGAKLSPGVKEVIEQFTGVSPGGFATEFANKGFGPQPAFFETIPKRIKNVADKFIPFSLRGDSFFFALPKSTFSTTNAIEGIEDAVKDRDRQGVADILKFAEANGLSIGFIKSQVKQRVEGADEFFPRKRKK